MDHGKSIGIIMDNGKRNFIILQHHVSTQSSCCGDGSNKRILTKNVKMNV